MAIPLETNMLSFRNTEETALGKEEKMMALITTPRCLVSVVV